MKRFLFALIFVLLAYVGVFAQETLVEGTVTEIVLPSPQVLTGFAWFEVIVPTGQKFEFILNPSAESEMFSGEAIILMGKLKVGDKIIFDANQLIDLPSGNVAIYRNAVRSVNGIALRQYLQ